MLDWKVLARHMSYRWDSLKILSLCILLVLILQELSELRSRKWRGKAKYISSNPFLTAHQTAWWAYSVQVSSRSYLIEVGKKISNKHQCKPLNTVSQSGKTVSLLLSKKSGANDGQILIKKQPTWEMSWHSLLKRDHPVEQWKQFVNYIPSEIKVFRFGLTSTKNWKICSKHRSISRFRRKSVVNPCNGSAVIVNPWNSASQSGKSMNYLVQHETWRSFPKSSIVFWQQEDKHFLVSYANLSFCYHSFCLWQKNIKQRPKLLE